MRQADAQCSTNLPHKLSDRLDEAKLAQIRAWAEHMLTEERAESRAAGRGLLMLADEVERLWEANRSAFGNDIRTALANRLGTEPGPGSV
jgi:hypothetical protein